MPFQNKKAKNIDSSVKESLEGSLLRLHNWLQINGWAGYDPYDVEHWRLSLPSFLNKKKYIKALAGLPVRLEKHYPLQIRKLLRIKKQIYPKAMGLFIESYVVMYKYFGDPEYLTLAKECAFWLINNVSNGYKGHGWGLPIDWQSRIFIPHGTPCGIVSVICGEGLWRLYKCTNNAKYLECCRQVCEGLIRNLNIDKVGKNAICFSFTPIDHFHVHNPNLLIAAFLVKLGQHLECQEYIDYGLKAANYALLEQRQDGSLTYWGRDQDSNGALDHYHSGFEIRAFHSLWKLTSEEKYQKAAIRFFDYYKDHFIGKEGAPWRNPDNPNLIDIHGCAEALICNAQLSANFPSAKRILKKRVVLKM